MSFIDDIIGVGKSVLGFVTGDSLGSNVLKTVLTGYSLNKVTNSINKSNNTNSTSGSAYTSTPSPDSGVKLQIPPAAENRVPIVYGTALTGGIINDVKMTADNQTMWYAVTICEVTGNLMSDGQPSEFTFEDVYFNNNRVVFNSDGITANYMVDGDGNIDRSISGLIQVYCYANGSSNPVVPDNYTNGSLSPAYSLMPGWTSNHTMSELVFALVKVSYSKEKNITGMPNLTFSIKNSMTMPGDCLFDYMTNTRYGAGISPLEIKSV